MADPIRLNKDNISNLHRRYPESTLVGTGFTDFPFINENSGAVFYLSCSTLINPVAFELYVDVGTHQQFIQTLTTIVTPNPGGLSIIKIPICPSVGYVRVVHTGDATVSLWAQSIDPLSESTISLSNVPSDDATVEEVSLPAATWTLISTMPGVRQVNIQNKSGQDVKINWTSPSQPTLTGVGFLGPTIVNNQERFYALNPDKTISLYVRCESAVNVIVEQLK